MYNSHLMDFIYVAAMSIYPIDDCCPNTYCDNRIPLKKEYCKKAVVFTGGKGSNQLGICLYTVKVGLSSGDKLTLTDHAFRVSHKLS
jgi:hypothetical protein